MAFDEGLAQRVRELLAERTDVVEKKMFGGLAFMVAGHMCCGVLGEALMARVGTERYRACLAQPHAREMDFTGRPLTGFVQVEPAGFESDDDLCRWIELCLSFVASLRPK